MARARPGQTPNCIINTMAAMTGADTRPARSGAGPRAGPTSGRRAACRRRERQTPKAQHEAGDARPRVFGLKPRREPHRGYAGGRQHGDVVGPGRHHPAPKEFEAYSGISTIPFGPHITTPAVGSKTDTPASRRAETTPEVLAAMRDGRSHAAWRRGMPPKDIGQEPRHCVRKRRPYQNTGCIRTRPALAGAWGEGPFPRA